MLQLQSFNASFADLTIIEYYFVYIYVHHTQFKFNIHKCLYYALFSDKQSVISQIKKNL